MTTRMHMTFDGSEGPAEGTWTNEGPVVVGVQVERGFGTIRATNEISGEEIVYHDRYWKIITRVEIRTEEEK